MARTTPTPADPDATRFVDAVVQPIVKATDLGNVQVLKHGNLYLLTDQFGDVHPDTRGLGLYEGDTRRLSCSILRVSGQRPVLLQASGASNFEGSIQMTNPRMERNPNDKIRPEEALDSQKLGIWRHRTITGTLLEERVRLVNHAEAPEDVELELDLGADAADIFEVRGWTRARRGRQLPVALRADRVTFRYDGLDGVRRSTHLSWSEAASSSGPVETDVAGSANAGWVTLCWAWHLEPGEEHELAWVVWTSERRVAGAAAGAAAADSAATADGAGTADADRDATDAGDEALFPPTPEVTRATAAAEYDAWGSDVAEMTTDNELFNLAIRRSTSDLRLLINDGPAPGEHYVAAGVPWFTTLFGRDSIISAYQALPVRPHLAVETLEVLASLQATDEDPARDAEPGKILHELRTGEMARSGEIPHRPYYGSVDSTPLWLILLSETYDWTGDAGLVDRLWPNVGRALEWIDRWGDRDGDGFVEYGRRTERGLVNQGWKDSGDAIRHRDGTLAEQPIALVEVQGYVFDAKRRIAALARMRGETALAERLEREAEGLRERFEAAFWLDDVGTYAMALDGRKRRADAIASNAGHALWSGIATPERARRVADRLFQRDMFSGWGIRTYADGQPGYNPIGYHTGSVWPHDVSLIAAGLRRYGDHERSNVLVGRMFDAARLFPDYRLPELFCGFDRAVSEMPVPYPVACSPQAWAAGSTFLLLQTMLGLRPHAERHELELARPQLPDWIRSARVSNLRIGDATVKILFHSWRGGTSAEVLDKTGDVDVTIRM